MSSQLKPSEVMNQCDLLRTSPRFRSAKKELMEALLSATEKVRGIKPATASAAGREYYSKSIQEMTRDRGRDLYFPFLGSGLGCGPYVELLDGSVKLDMITGIGVNFFGHSHPELMEASLDGISADIMQGNLEPGIEMKDLLRTLLSNVGPGSRLTHGWITCSGTMANEIALKIVRQKKAPATKVLAFKDCFAGRSTTMQEITDNPAYRQGQPVYGEVQYLPFYDPRLGLSASLEATLSVLKENLARYPGKFAAIIMELVLGEGGFCYAPKEFYQRMIEEAKKAGLAIWIDEVQTFGRTGELFAYQKFSVSESVDVVTAGKLLQACAVLFTDEYTPKPGLVAGTFAGSTTALRTAQRITEILCHEGYLGPDGKIEKLSRRFREQFEKLSETSCKGMIREIRAIGGMIAFAPFSGSMDDVKAVLLKLFDLGLIAFYCGHGPYLVRLLPPLGVMTESEVDESCRVIEQALLQVSKERRQS